MNWKRISEELIILDIIKERRTIDE